MFIAFLFTFGEAAVSLAAIALSTAVLLRVFPARSAPKPLPPDPRTPAVNLVAAPELAVDMQAVGELDPTVLECGHCGHVSIAGSTLAAISVDQDHFREVHALRLAIDAVAS